MAKQKHANPAKIYLRTGGLDKKCRRVLSEIVRRYKQRSESDCAEKLLNRDMEAIFDEVSRELNVSGIVRTDVDIYCKAYGLGDGLAHYLTRIICHRNNSSPVCGYRFYEPIAHRVHLRSMQDYTR